jgi:CxxC-x17-CxxC domain-containing protein
MHDAVCADCGKQTQVPFRPTEGRPVYCRDCFSKRKPARY